MAFTDTLEVVVCIAAMEIENYNSMHDIGETDINKIESSIFKPINNRSIFFSGFCIQLSSKCSLTHPPFWIFIPESCFYLIRIADNFSQSFKIKIICYDP